MITVLAFVLECAATAALISATAWLGMVVTLGVLRPIARYVRPALRADCAFLGAFLPAVLAVAGMLSAAVPPLASVLGWVADHCNGHTHHAHLCLLHPSAPRPALAALGAFTIAAVVLRASALVQRLLQAQQSALELERLGERMLDSYPVIALPGAPRLCHAVGFVRRRILLSRALVQRLSGTQLECALAHERAHLQRWDGLANLLMSTAALVLPPFAVRPFRSAYRRAAEEDCDARAATAVGDGAAVADALVAVAAIQQRPWLREDAFGVWGEHPLEMRVRRLLGPLQRSVGPAYGVPIGASLSAGIFACAFAYATFFHHAVETALDLLF
jgi:Zn-dependent protease with chaperone function